MWRRPSVPVARLAGRDDRELRADWPPGWLMAAPELGLETDFGARSPAKSITPLDPPSPATTGQPSEAPTAPPATWPPGRLTSDTALPDRRPSRPLGRARRPEGPVMIIDTSGRCLRAEDQSTDDLAAPRSGAAFIELAAGGGGGGAQLSDERPSRQLAAKQPAGAETKFMNGLSGSCSAAVRSLCSPLSVCRSLPIVARAGTDQINSLSRDLDGQCKFAPRRAGGRRSRAPIMKPRSGVAQRGFLLSRPPRTSGAGSSALMIAQNSRFANLAPLARSLPLSLINDNNNSASPAPKSPLGRRAEVGGASMWRPTGALTHSPLTLEMMVLVVVQLDARMLASRFSAARSSVVRARTGWPRLEADCKPGEPGEWPDCGLHLSASLARSSLTLASLSARLSPLA